MLHNGRMRRFTGWAALAVVITAVWSVFEHPWGWLYGIGVHPYPASGSTPWTYQMWSGIIPALTVLTLFGAVIQHYRAINCHVHRCWRIGRFEVAGGQYKVCRRHHPFHSQEDCGRITADHIRRVHFTRLEDGK